MKFYEFLNEARINYKSATAEEIAKGILLNYENDKTKAYNYLRIYAKVWHAKDESIYHKIMKACEIIKHGSTNSSQEKTQEKKSTYTNQKEIDEQVDFFIKFTNDQKDFNYYCSHIRANRAAGTSDENREFWTKVLNLYKQKYEEKATKNKQSYYDTQPEDDAFFDKIKGVKFCLTGTGPYTRKNIEEDIKQAGGYIYDIKYCDVLVCSDINSNSSKMRYAKANGIKIITYNDLYKVYKNNPFGHEEEKPYEKKQKIYQETPHNKEKLFNNLDSFFQYKTPRFIIIELADNYLNKDALDYINHKIKTTRYNNRKTWKYILDEYNASYVHEFSYENNLNIVNKFINDTLRYGITPMELDRYTRRIDDNIKSATEQNDQKEYLKWTEIKELFRIKYKEAEQEYIKKQQQQEKTRREQEEARKRNQEDAYRKQQQRNSFTDQQRAKSKNLILKNVTPIPKDKFSYKTLLMKIHPDFHQNGEHEIATEMMKLVNANRDNLAILKQYARDWKLLSEKQEFIEVYEYLMETINKY